MNKEKYMYPDCGATAPGQGVSAFPLADGEGHWNLGMTLRDYFAGQALLTLDRKEYLDCNSPLTAMATTAYMMADRMLQAREDKTIRMENPRQVGLPPRSAA